MKLAFFTGTRKPWYVGLGNRLVRLRLGSRISHCELVFEPEDGVDDLMPLDGRTLRPTTNSVSGELWCASSAAAEPIPAFSPRRAGKHGGVRFKRIDLSGPDWTLVSLDHLDAAQRRAAAVWFKEHQGALYDWQGIFGFLAWPIPNKRERWTCHEACAAALGIAEPHRLDPVSLARVSQWRAA